MIKKLVVILLILFSFISTNLYALVFPSAKCVLENNVVNTGDIVRVNFEIIVPDFVKFVQDDNIVVDGWEIKNISFKKDVRVKGKFVVGIDLVTYNSLVKQIPAVKFSYVNKDFENNDEIFSFFSAPMPVVVNDIFEQESFNYIRDIKSPKKIEISKFVYIFIFLFIVFVIVFVYKNLLVKKFYNEIKIGDFSNKEVAIRKINKLLQNEDLSSQNIKRYYFLLSNILKEFILHTHNINTQKTTFELLSIIQNEDSCFFECNKEIEMLLKKYDFVKYSNASVNNKEFVDIFSHTKNIIERY